MKCTLKTLSDIDFNGKDILLRVDFNVPLNEGTVTDDTRIRAVLPTINKLIKGGARIALISHLGRPKGAVNPDYSLKAILPTLQNLLPDIQISFKSDYCGMARDIFWGNTEKGELILCENIRFYPGEEKNDVSFAAQLASLADLYVNDAFAACHRAHASITAITEFLPSVAGDLLGAEISSLESHYINAKKPLMAVIGGAKVSSKIEVLNALMNKVDILAIGGGMANSFLKAKGINIGKSLFEESAVPLAKDIMARADAEHKKLLLPIDVVTAAELAAHIPTTLKKAEDVGDEDSILDIGPETAALYGEAASNVKTLLWNGPLGAFEIKPFDQGTLTFASRCADLTKAGQLASLTGGGDSVAALTQLGLASAFTYVSTGGGAFLEFLEGKTLPGLAVLAQDGDINDKVNIR